mgnify:CR=1 FL=1
MNLTLLLLGASPLDSARHILDDPEGIPRFAHHADLHVDDQQAALLPLRAVATAITSE